MSCQKQTKEDVFLPKFERSLLFSKYKYKLVRNYVGIDHPTAIIMTPEGYPHCIIEVSDKDLSSETDPEIIKIEKELETKVANAKARFAVITNGKDYKLFESGGSDFQNKQYDEIKTKIISGTDAKDLINQYLKNNFTVFKKGKLDSVNDLVDLKEQQAFLKEEEVERKWMKELFKFQDFFGPIYRYTSLEAVFKILESGKIRMNGIAGMNDKSEVDYVEKILYGSAIPLNSEINKTFILSCSVDKEDDLTQWRLYADDAKGVCLKFEPKKKLGSDFCFRKIEYVDGENYKPIERLKELVKYVYKVTGYTFVFKTLNKWCHFIKPKDYRVESEIRLLHSLPEKLSGWVLANGTNIVNPYMEFDLTEFPLKLVDIKLGPKCPEAQINENQLKKIIENQIEQLGKLILDETDRMQKEKLEQKKNMLNSINISHSKIKHYR